jgi:hypothetical protein
LHDWSDEACLTILRNCRAAGGSEARLLIIESLLGDVGAPDPVALFDMNMLAAPHGRQRSMDEIREPREAAAWRLAETAPTRASDYLLDLEAIQGWMLSRSSRRLGCVGSQPTAGVITSGACVAGDAGGECPRRARGPQDTCFPRFGVTSPIVRVGPEWIANVRGPP